MRCFCLFSSLFFLLSIFLPGCTQQDIKPSSSGKPGEIIVIIDSALWKLQPGKTIRDSLMASFPALPQDEPMFKIIRVQPSDFKNILQLHRNVLMVETGQLQNDRNYLLTFKNNVWASPQLVLNLRAINETQLDSALLPVMSSIVERFMTEERNRMIASLKKTKTLQAGLDLKNALGVTMPFTEDFFVAKNEKGYVWIRKETIQISMGFQFTRVPYTHDSLFNPASVIALRDSISKAHIPGPSAGSYMTTDSNFPLTYSTVSIDSSYSKEVRGLWRTQGDFMGGPFVCYLIHDKKKNELLFVDAYVYAPKFNKREYVKQMEAMVHSISF